LNLVVSLLLPEKIYSRSLWGRRVRSHLQFFRGRLLKIGSESRKAAEKSRPKQEQTTTEHFQEASQEHKINFTDSHESLPDCLVVLQK
jgi:hypothetical protein